MAAAAAWRAARHKTATSLLAAAPTERFEAFVRNWAESDDEPYAARGQTLACLGEEWVWIRVWSGLGWDEGRSRSAWAGMRGRVRPGLG